MSKVFVAGDVSYYWPHQEFGELEIDASVIEAKPNKIKLVVFIGGSDVSPALYGHEKNTKTYCNVFDDNRDLHFFNIAQKNNIPCVGICRGGQFLTVQAGGFLFQLC